MFWMLLGIGIFYYILIQYTILGIRGYIETIIERKYSEDYEREIRSDRFLDYIEPAKESEFISEQEIQGIQKDIHNIAEYNSFSASNRVMTSDFVLALIIWIGSSVVFTAFIREYLEQSVVNQVVSTISTVPILAIFSLISANAIIARYTKGFDNKELKKKKKITSLIRFTSLFFFDIILESIRLVVYSNTSFNQLMQLIITFCTLIAAALIQFGYTSRIVTETLLKDKKESASNLALCAASLRTLLLIRTIARKKFMEFCDRQKIEPPNNSMKTETDLLIKSGFELFSELDNDDERAKIELQLLKALHESHQRKEFRLYDEYSKLVETANFDSTAIKILLAFDNRDYRKIVVKNLRIEKAEKSLEQVARAIALEVIAEDQNQLLELISEIASAATIAQLKDPDFNPRILREGLRDFVIHAKKILSFVDYIYKFVFDETQLKLRKPSPERLGREFSNQLFKVEWPYIFERIYQMMGQKRSKKKVPFKVILSCFIRHREKNPTEANILAHEFLSSKEVERDWTEILVRRSLEIKSPTKEETFLYDILSQLFSKNVPVPNEFGNILRVLPEMKTYLKCVISLPVIGKERSDKLVPPSKVITDSTLISIRDSYPELMFYYAQNSLELSLGEALGLVITALDINRWFDFRTQNLGLYETANNHDKIACLNYLTCYRISEILDIDFKDFLYFGSRFALTIAKATLQFMQNQSSLDFTLESQKIQNLVLEAFVNQSKNEGVELSIVVGRLKHYDVQPLSEILGDSYCTKERIEFLTAFLSSVDDDLFVKKIDEYLSTGNYIEILRTISKWFSQTSREERIKIIIQRLMLHMIAPPVGWDNNKQKLRHSALVSFLDNLTNIIIKRPRICEKPSLAKLLLDIVRLVGDALFDLMKEVDRFELKRHGIQIKIETDKCLKSLTRKISKGTVLNLDSVVFEIIESVMNSICEGSQDPDYILFLITVLLNNAQSSKLQNLEEYVRTLLRDNYPAKQYAIVFREQFEFSEYMMMLRYFNLVEPTKSRIMDVKSGRISKNDDDVAMNEIEVELQSSGWISKLGKLKESEERAIESQVMTEISLAESISLKELIENPDARGRRLARALQSLVFKWKLTHSRMDEIISQRSYNLFLLVWHDVVKNHNQTRPLKASSLFPDDDFKYPRDIVKKWLAEYAEDYGYPFTVGNSARVCKVPENLKFEELKQKVYREFSRECLIHLNTLPRVLLIRWAPSRFSVQALLDFASTQLDVVPSMIRTYQGIEGRTEQIERFERQSILGQLTLFETLTAFKLKMDDSYETVYDLINQSPLSLLKGMLTNDGDIDFLTRSENRMREVIDAVKDELGYVDMIQLAKDSSLESILESKLMIITKSKRDRTRTMMIWLFQAFKDIEEFFEFHTESG